MYDVLWWIVWKLDRWMGGWMDYRLYACSTIQTLSCIIAQYTGQRIYARALIPELTNYLGSRTYHGEYLFSLVFHIHNRIVWQWHMAINCTFMKSNNNHNHHHNNHNINNSSNNNDTNNDNRNDNCTTTPKLNSNFEWPFGFRFHQIYCLVTHH